MEKITAKRIIIAALCLLLPLGLLALPRLRHQPVQQGNDAPQAVPSVTRPLPGSRNPWTLAEARAALERQPDDGYLQYVALQLARQENRLAEVRDEIRRFAAHRDLRPVDLFGVFGNTRTLQQRLQLQAITDSAALSRDPAAKGVSLKELRAPDVVHRPWKKLLDGKSPAVSPLSRCVPEDCYLAEFRSLDRLAAVLDAGQAWFSFLQVQAAQDATDRQVRRRLQEHLVFDVADKALTPLVEQVALTGSDPFLGEGSDVTVLVRLRPDAIEAFRSRTERALAAAAAQPGAGRSTGKYLDIDYAYVASADRRINAYAVTLPAERLHIRSNSRAALERVLNAVQRKATALGETDEFRYIRTQLPFGANEEDGLIYLPQGFLARLVGPALQITEARRLIGYNHLRMIANAAQLYRTQFGKSPASLDELTRTGCAPGTFNEGALASPLGGTYALGADGVTGVCSVLGTADHLAPCIDRLATSATAVEAEAYRAFAQTFGAVSGHWLAPIALRLQTGPRTTRFEVLVLAPPDNPALAGLAQLLGAEPAALDPLPVARSSVASLSIRLNKDRWSKRALTEMPPRRRSATMRLGSAFTSAVPAPFVARVPWSALVARVPPSPPYTAPAVLEALGIEPSQLRPLLERGIGDQAAIHVCDAAAAFDVSLPAVLADAARAARAARQEDGDALRFYYELWVLFGRLMGPAYMAIPVKDAQVVDAFLSRLDASLARVVPTWRGKLFDIPLPMQGEFYHLATKGGPPTRCLGVRAGPVRYRLCWARIGDGLYISTQPGVLDELRKAARERSPLAASERGPVAHAMFKLRAPHVTLGLAGVRLSQEEANREACQRNLAMLSAAARAFSFTPPVTRLALDQETRQRLVFNYAGDFYGCRFTCPDGGRYTLAEDGRSFTCSVHGSLAHPQQPERPSGAERLAEASATLMLAPDGVRVVVTLVQR